ncbi:MAG: hypothetical protein M3367_04155 [Acidobacteriota bacterium]|nr:hypothetical protein [Acidobacteriota bacterium]
MNKKTFLTILLTLCFVVSALAQDPPDKKDRVVGEVTVTATKANVDPAYVQLRKQSENANAFSGEYATVNNLVLKRDAATFTLRSGEIYFLTAVDGKTTGAGNINLPQTPKRVAICALNDGLATKIENIKR